MAFSFTRVNTYVPICVDSKYKLKLGVGCACKVRVWGLTF